MSARRPQQQPRPVTPAYLRNAALAYLQQRAASVAMLRQTLTRRARRRLQVKRLEPETAALIEQTIAALAVEKLVDDAAFAEGRRRTLEGRGLSRRRIAAGLGQKGVGKEMIATALADAADDLTLARRFAERRRLGVHSRKSQTPEQRRKDLAALGRAGFSYAVAVKALDEAAE